MIIDGIKLTEVPFSYRCDGYEKTLMIIDLFKLCQVLPL